MSGLLDIHALYDAFNARDIDTVLAFLAPNVVWPNGWEGGKLHGRAEVRDYWLRQWEAINPTVTPMGNTLESDGRTAVHVHQIVRDLDGVVLSRGEVIHVYRAVNGLIQSMEIRGGQG